MKTIHIVIIVITSFVFSSSNFVFAQNEAQPTIYFDHLNYGTEKMTCNFYNTGKISPIDQQYKKATITVTDPSANKFSTSIDKVAMLVWSDSDKEGIEITAYETDVNSGIFKGTVTISEGQSTQGIIHVTDGDTLWANYASTTPWSLNTQNHGITTTAFIGTTCPPLERVPASGINFTDNEGNEQKAILAGKQVQIGSVLSNPTIRDQNFTYIVQIYDKYKNPESVSWVSGLLHPSQTFSPRVSWAPLKAGDYTVQVFVWQSINNPNSLSPPLSADLTVWPNLSAYTGHTISNLEIARCQSGYEFVIKSNNHSTACVTPDTARKLVERGWTKDGPAIAANELIPRLHLYTNATSIQQGHSIGITISLDNPYKYPLTLEAKGDWPIQGLDMGSCFDFPLGVAIMKGYYTEQNMTYGHPMIFHYLYPCPPEQPIKSFTFQPQSNNVTSTCEPKDWGPCMHVTQTKTSIAYKNFLDNGTFVDFKDGIYTIVGGDEWGGVAIEYFTVNSNPLGVTALVIYSPPDACLGMACPPYTFYLKINSNSTAYLLGYDICGNDLCARNNTLSVLLPKNNMQIADYTYIGLSENKKWNYNDTVDIGLEISSTPDNKTAYFLDIKNSTIVP